MISLKKRNQGFTIVELLIVIVVIGILALLVITTYAGIQQKARNSKRSTDLNSVQTQLEAFYSQNGYYPNLTDMNSDTWRKANMKSLNPQALKDPSSTCNPETTTTCVKDTAGAKAYSYVAKDSSGNPCDGASPADQNCAQYTMTATYEGDVNGQATYVKTNLD